MLKVTILGCGTSSGVPRIGNDWGSCDPAERKNRRTRPSIMVETETTRILVDTSPDMREQLLAANVIDIDAVLWTHDHADHSHGLDDVRQLAHHRGSPMPGYARTQTLALLQRRFVYAFQGHGPYPPIIIGNALNDAPNDDLVIGDIAVTCVDQPHGDIYSTGFRFMKDGKSIGYATDFHEVTSEMAAFFKGIDLWVVDGLREQPHPSHPHLALTLDAIAAAKPGRAVLTHMDQSMDYLTLKARLPAGVEPGYDGMTITL